MYIALVSGNNVWIKNMFGTWWPLDIKLKWSRDDRLMGCTWSPWSRADSAGRGIPHLHDHCPAESQQLLWSLDHMMMVGDHLTFPHDSHWTPEGQCSHPPSCTWHCHSHPTQTHCFSSAMAWQLRGAPIFRVPLQSHPSVAEHLEMP